MNSYLVQKMSSCLWVRNDFEEKFPSYRPRQGLIFIEMRLSDEYDPEWVEYSCFEQSE